jgi:uncharacterized lipoprotein YmbA
MMRATARWYLALCALATLAGLGGCASQAPAVRFYVLAPQAAAVASAEAADLAIVVAPVRLPQYLERPQIVTRSGEHRLQLAEFDRWGGNLRQDMTRVLAQNLARLLGSERVVAAPHTLALQPDFRVEVEVLRFERAADGRVHLAATWRLRRGADSAALASLHAELRGAALSEEDAFDALVASMSEVYGELARRIAQSVRRHAAARS